MRAMTVAIIASIVTAVMYFVCHLPSYPHHRKYFDLKINVRICALRDKSIVLIRINIENLKVYRLRSILGVVYM